VIERFDDERQFSCTIDEMSGAEQANDSVTRMTDSSSLNRPNDER
jgi:hypothetical protein